MTATITMSTEEALMVAFASVCADRTLINDERVAAMKTLEALLEQKGCEHLDGGRETGRLTAVCDMAIFG